MERQQCCGLAVRACPTSHTTEKLGVLRDEERWEKWEISLEKREKQHTGVVSFPGLAPDTDGLKEQHRQSHPGGMRCPTGH